MDRKQEQHSPQADTARKAYESPQIVSREPLEALAAACGQPGNKDVLGAPGCTDPTAVQS